MLKIQGFSPYIIVLFLNAFTDLGHKITIHNTLIKAYDGAELVIFSALINAMILLPFVMLFTPAGYLSDKFPKNKIMQFSAWFAVLITLGITASYYLGLFWISFALTFLLALQSALYSPAKYGYIKELVGVEKLSKGNAWVQGTTIVAILLGTVFYTVVFENSLPMQHMNDTKEILQSVTLVGWLLVAGSIVELILSYRIPQKMSTDTALRFDIPKYLRSGYLLENLRTLHKKPIVWFSVIILSFVFAISQVVLATFPAFAKEAFNEDNTIFVQGTMLLASIGIILGSVLAAKVSKNSIETGVIPLGGAGITVVVLAIPFIGSLFLQSINFFFFGLFFGLMLVPLNALIQYHASEHEMGTVIAGNNFIQNIFMVSFLFGTMLFTLWHISVVTLFYLMAIISLGMTVYTVKKLPDAMWRFIVYFMLSRRYKLHVSNTQNIPSEGGVLLLGNHISWLDWAIISKATIRPINFMMERTIYERWYLKWFLDYFDAIPVSMKAGKDAYSEVQKRLNNGEVVCIFPEGSISRTGNLGTFYKGFERFAKGANAVIVPFYMHGLWGSFFSRSSTRVRHINKIKNKRDIIIEFGKAMPIESNREDVKQAIFTLSFSCWRAYTQGFPSLHVAWLQSAKKYTSNLAIADTSGVQLSYTQLVVEVLHVSGLLVPHKHIGLMLPTSVVGAVANLAVLVQGKVACNLDYTASPSMLKAAIAQADIKTIYTSRTLSSQGEVLADVVEVVYIEDLQARLTKRRARWLWLMVRCLPTWIIRRYYLQSVSINDTAQILFTHKQDAVVLTHKNIMTNIRQISDTLNETQEDVMMNVLPLHHAMGLNAMLLKPLIDGTTVICHPNPRDAVAIGKAIAKYQATVLAGTSTMYRMYTRQLKLLPLMFDSLRLVVAGGEKLRIPVAKAFKAKFGKDIYEGYGVTEVSAISGINTPDQLDTTYWMVQQGHKLGTVGLPLPGTAYKIVDPITLTPLDLGQEGLVLIGGVQMMKGYYKDEKKTHEAILEIDGLPWFKTDDTGSLDADGFLTLIGRRSRPVKRDNAGGMT